MNSFDIYTFGSVDTLYNILSYVSGGVGKRYLLFVLMVAVNFWLWRYLGCASKLAILMVTILLLPTATIHIRDVSAKGSPSVRKIENFPWALALTLPISCPAKAYDRKTPEKINQEGK